MKHIPCFLMVIAVALCVEWTRFSGTVKAVNLKASTVTLQDKNGDLFTIPVDYQVNIVEKSGDIRALKDVHLDEKVTLTRIQFEQPKEDTEGLAQPEPSQRGR